MKIKLNELRAMALFCALEENRGAQCGVMLEHRTANQPRMVATNGQVLAVLETEVDNEPAAKEWAVTLHRLAIGVLPAGDAVLDVSLENGALIITNGKEQTWSFGGSNLIAKKFPNFLAVLPTKLQEDSERPFATLSGSYMALIERSAEILQKKNNGLNLRFSGELNAVEFHIPSVDNFYGVWMPMRVDQINNGLRDKLFVEAGAKAKNGREAKDA